MTCFFTHLFYSRDKNKIHQLTNHIRLYKFYLGYKDKERANLLQRVIFSDTKLWFLFATKLPVCRIMAT